MKKIAVLFSFCLFFMGCENSAEEKPNGFRPHIVRHCNEQGKIEWFYHMQPYECPGVETDLCRQCNYEKSYKNYIKYYDNGETIYGN